MGHHWPPRPDRGSLSFLYHQLSCLRCRRVVHEELAYDPGVFLREAIEEQLCVLVEVLHSHLVLRQEAKLMH
jgi:hypothetical protein